VNGNREHVILRSLLEFLFTRRANILDCGQLTNVLSYECKMGRFQVFLSYVELQKFLLHRKKKRSIFATIKAPKREYLKGEAALFGESKILTGI